MDHRQSVLLCELQVVSDLSVVDALARLQLVVRRRGGRLTVWAGGDLTALLALSGLGLVLQPGGQAESREEGGGVEEVVEVDEPPP